MVLLSKNMKNYIESCFIFSFLHAIILTVYNFHICVLYPDKLSPGGNAVKRKPRFPDIDWYCDRCDAYLNSQRGFDDHKYLWKCKKCGYKNSISWDNISRSDSAALKCLLYLIGFISYTCFWTAVMLGVSIFALKADKSIYFTPFLICLGGYIFAFVLSILVEFGFRHTKLSGKNFLIVVLRNLKEELISPFMYVKEIISNLLSLITRLLPFKRRYVWHSNLMIVAFAIVYVSIFCLELVAFNKITGYGFSDLVGAIKNLISNIA